MLIGTLIPYFDSHTWMTSPTAEGSRFVGRGSCSRRASLPVKLVLGPTAAMQQQQQQQQKRSRQAYDNTGSPAALNTRVLGAVLILMKCCTAMLPDMEAALSCFPCCYTAPRGNASGDLEALSSTSEQHPEPQCIV